MREAEGYVQKEFKSTVIARATLLRAKNAAGAPARGVVILMARSLGLKVLKESQHIPGRSVKCLRVV